jgi:hypothetical protein
MKKSSGYGSALGPGEGNKRFRAGGTAVLSAAAAASRTASGRWRRRFSLTGAHSAALGQFGLQPAIGGGHIAAAHIFAAAQQALRRGGVFQGSRQGKVRLIAWRNAASGRDGQIAWALAGVGGGIPGDFALRQRQLAAAETGALARGVDIRDAGLLPAVNLDRLLRRGAAEQQPRLDIGYQPVADSQPIAGDSPLDAALAQRNGFQPRCAVGADRLAPLR